MSLLNTRHRDETSAALAIAGNRASKCQLLRREGYADVADRYVVNLFYDVREFVVLHPDVPDSVCERLHEIVASAR